MVIQIMTKEQNFLLKIFLPHKWRILLCISLILIYTTLEGILLYTTKLAVDYNSNTIIQNPWFFIGLLMIVYLLIEFVIKQTDFIVIKFLPTCMINLQYTLAQKLINANWHFHQNQNTGRIITQTSRILDTVENLFFLLLYGIVAGSFSFIATIILISFSKNWLAIYFLMWFIFMVFIGIIAANKIKLKSEIYAKELSHINGELSDTCLNMLTVKSYMAENYELERYSSILDKFKQIKLQLHKLLFIVDYYRSMVSLTFFMVLVYYVIRDIGNQHATIGDFVFVISAALICRQNIWRVSLQLVDVYKHWGVIKEVTQLLDQVKDNTEYLSCNTINKKRRKIALTYLELNNISLIIEKRNILQNLSLQIRCGEKIAIIGPSGSGKSSLAKLIATIYKPDTGQIIINNDSSNQMNNIHQCKISYVSQEPVLFNRSIFENIVYAKNHQFNQLKLDRAMKISLCKQFVDALPNKSKTRALDLSTGQKHRIAIARAIYQDDDWLILDEPTSALDPITEEGLIRNLLKYAQHKTLLVITHNPNIIKLMNRVVVVENSKISADSFCIGQNQAVEQNNFYKQIMHTGQLY